MAGIFGFTREAVRVKVKVITHKKNSRPIFCQSSFVSGCNDCILCLCFFFCVTLNLFDSRNVRGHYHLNGVNLASIHKLLR